MNYSTSWVGILVAALFVVSCGKPPETSPETPSPDPALGKGLDSQPAFPGDPLVVLWHNGKLYLSQIDKILYDRFRVVQRLDVLPTLTKENLAAERKAILEKLVDNYMLMLESERSGVTLSPQDEEALRKQLRGMFSSEEEYQQNIQNSGQSEEEYVRILGSMKRIEVFLRQKQEGIREAITPEDIRAYYDQNIGLFSPPHRTQYNEVVVSFGENRTEEEAKTSAQKMRDEVNTKINEASDMQDKRKVIQDCAYANSDGENAKYNYGYTTMYHDTEAQAYHDKDFLDVLKAQPVGTLSNVVKNKDRYVFFWVMDQMPSNAQAFDSPAVQKTVPNLIVEQEMKSWQASLRTVYGCQIFDEPLRTHPYCGPVAEAEPAGQVDSASVAG